MSRTVTASTLVLYFLRWTACFYLSTHPKMTRKFCLQYFDILTKISSSIYNCLKLFTFCFYQFNVNFRAVKRYFRFRCFSFFFWFFWWYFCLFIIANFFFFRFLRSIILFIWCQNVFIKIRAATDAFILFCINFLVFQVRLVIYFVLNGTVFGLLLLLAWVVYFT